MVAAYFAVASLEKTKKGDAAIWAVNPGAINFENSRTVQTRAILDKDDENVRVTAAAAFGAKFHDVFAPRPALAVVAQEFDLRMLVQRAHFTLHGDDKPLDEAVEEIADNKENLTCYPIARRFRKQLRDGLQFMGIDRGFLFPDPDNMAAAILAEQELLSKVRKISGSP